jgi:hypothetical protein
MDKDLPENGWDFALGMAFRPEMPGADTTVFLIEARIHPDMAGAGLGPTCCWRPERTRQPLSYSHLLAPIRQPANTGSPTHAQINRGVELSRDLKAAVKLFQKPQLPIISELIRSPRYACQIGPQYAKQVSFGTRAFPYSLMLHSRCERAHPRSGPSVASVGLSFVGEGVGAAGPRASGLAQPSALILLAMGLVLLDYVSDRGGRARTDRRPVHFERLARLLATSQLAADLRRRLATALDPSRGLRLFWDSVGTRPTPG